MREAILPPSVVGKSYEVLSELIKDDVEERKSDLVEGTTRHVGGSEDLSGERTSLYHNLTSLSTLLRHCICVNIPSALPLGRKASRSFISAIQYGN